jgi:hypothetical protein
VHSFTLEPLQGGAHVVVLSQHGLNVAVQLAHALGEIEHQLLGAADFRRRTQ